MQHIVGISPNNGGVTQSCGTHAMPEDRLLCRVGSVLSLPVPGQGVQRRDVPYLLLGQRPEITPACMSFRSLLGALLKDVPNTWDASRDAPEERVPSQLSRLRKSFLQGLD